YGRAAAAAGGYGRTRPSFRSGLRLRLRGRRARSPRRVLRVPVAPRGPMAVDGDRPGRPQDAPRRGSSGHGTPLRGGVVPDVRRLGRRGSRDRRLRGGRLPERKGDARGGRGHWIGGAAPGEDPQDGGAERHGQDADDPFLERHGQLLRESGGPAGEENPRGGAAATGPPQRSARPSTYRQIAGVRARKSSGTIFHGTQDF